MSAQPEEIAAIRESIANVLDETCDSRALHDGFDGKIDLAGELQRMATELGWLAIGLPEAAGGFGIGAVGLALLHQELGRAAAPGNLLAQSVALDVLGRLGQAETTPLIEAGLAGEQWFAIPACLGDPAKASLFLGDPRSDFALVARGQDDLAVVALTGGASDRLDMWDRTRSLFDRDLTGEPALHVLPGARPVLESLTALAIAADSAGLARGIAERTLEFMKGREQFGQPIAAFQALKHRMADIFLSIATAEHLVAQAADALAPGGVAPGLWALQAKATVTDTASKVSADCVQLHGGVGFTWEYDPHIYLKRARLNEMLLGRNGILRDRALDMMEQAVMAGQNVMELAVDH